MNHRLCCVLWVASALVQIWVPAHARAGQDPRERFAQAQGGVNEQLPPADRGHDDETTKEGDEQPPEHFRIGVLGGVGFPRPLSIEGLIKIERLLAVGLDYGVLPTINISDVSVSFWSLAADARVFPFRDAFFIGLRAGYQRLGASTTVTVAQLGSASVAAEVSTTFLNPRLGFLWTWESGITFGLDAGIQIPLHSHVETQMPAIAQGSAIDQELLTVANDVGQSVLPTVDLLRIGLLL